MHHRGGAQGRTRAARHVRPASWQGRV